VEALSEQPEPQRSDYLAALSQRFEEHL
jgi:hypothetical protein